MLDGGVVDDLVTKQRPLLHQTEHAFLLHVCPQFVTRREGLSSANAALSGWAQCRISATLRRKPSHPGVAQIERLA
jgi:hypothetical protein